jgi:hypothetical protein
LAGGRAKQPQPLRLEPLKHTLVKASTCKGISVFASVPPSVLITYQGGVEMPVLARGSLSVVTMLQWAGESGICHPLLLLSSQFWGWRSVQAQSRSLRALAGSLVHLWWAAGAHAPQASEGLAGLESFTHRSGVVGIGGSPQSFSMWLVILQTSLDLFGVALFHSCIVSFLLL